MDPIKEAFSKIKEDISSLQHQISELKLIVSSLKQDNWQTNTSFLPANNAIASNTSAQSPALPQEIRGFQDTFNNTSTGNKGVPTDNKADSQADLLTDKHSQINVFKIQETLDSLDAIRKELRLKFKRLTSQEMLVFSTLFSLENEGIQDITYKTLSSHLNLTESSIRDYVTKLLSKGVPIRKTKQNNKIVLLSISPELKKIANLSTIIKLRDL